MPGVSKNPDKKIFRDKYFVLQGNFTSGDLSARQNEVRSHKNIAKLILKYGGGVDQNVTNRTTHVVTTVNEFKRNPPNSTSDCFSAREEPATTRSATALLTSFVERASSWNCRVHAGAYIQAP